MFEDCRADLNLINCAKYLWTAGTQKKLTSQLTGLSKPTIITVYSFLTVMWKRYFQNNLIKLGGEGSICQLDQSMFPNKPKHHQVEHQKPRDGFVRCLFTTVHKKGKIVTVRYKIQIEYNLYIKKL
jgi:hypothetical protein